MCSYKAISPSRLLSEASVSTSQFAEETGGFALSHLLVVGGAWSSTRSSYCLFLHFP